MNGLSNEHKGSLYAVVSGILYGFLGYFGVTIMNDNFSIPNMLFWRFLVSGVIIGLIALPSLKKNHENRADLLKIFFYGTCFYTGSAILYFISSRYLGTGVSMVVFFVYPAIVMLLNWMLYGIKITRVYYVAIALITAGMILLIGDEGSEFGLTGVVLGLLGATCYSLYIVSNRNNNVSPLASTFMLSLGCSISCLLLSYADHSFVVPDTWQLWFNILGVGIIGTAFPILFFLESLKYIHAEKASILSVLEPVFVVIFGVILLGEKISLLRISGVVVILVGALLTMFTSKQVA